MHAVALRALRTAQRPISRSACRIVAGCRHPLPHRAFHRSPFLCRTSEDPADKGKEAKGKDAEVEEVEDKEVEGREGEEKHAEGKEAPQIDLEATPEGFNLQDEGAPSFTPEIEDLALTPKKVARLSRNRPKNQITKPEGLPPFILPQWFLERNVKCLGDPELSGSLAVFALDAENLDTDSLGAAEQARQAIAIEECNLQPTKSAKYSIHVDVYNEILSSLRTALILRPPTSPRPQSVVRPPIVLQCPKDGGSYYLDSVVETIAAKLDADLIRIDAQDLAQIVGPYIDENLAWSQSGTALLGFEAQRVAGKLEEFDKEEEEESEEEPEEAEGIMGAFSKLNLPFLSGPNANKGLRTRFWRDLSQQSRMASNRNSRSPFGTVVAMPIGGPPGEPLAWQPQQLGNSNDQWNDLKLSTALEALVTATDLKRRDSKQSDTSKNIRTNDKSRGLIVQIRDYKELLHTIDGANLLPRLRTIINKKWQDGKNIICVGTTSSEEEESALSRPEIQNLQSDIAAGEKRTIFVPPDRREEQENAFESDEKTRIRHINIRHIEDMLLKLTEGTQHLKPVISIEKELDSATVFSAGLEDAVWTFSRVHRVATTILGLDSNVETIDGIVLARALKVLSASDEAKFYWGAEELKKEDKEVDEMVEETESRQSKSKKNLKDIASKCNAHEKKLLSGVISPEDMRTTFADIQAPKETVEALKTLTSLSLVRPEAFSYGVLATDKIPGLLLYGPPGTGKTLLAKAVAKESGATMLEVSAADMNDMFVGEGEKNVRALFSLAKKLSPCVVFIDEADALFTARGDSRRAAHRELINQFLREWDGMNSLGAFIMVATNRPFDLDEAVLRRLPRRLLIDLPVEKERENILKIHLKDEVLADSVSLAQLAKDTPFYSGSDLKNLSVAAALACIREENDLASKHTGEEPFVYPPKRTLTKQHFDKAMGEISASISEDMSTLTAIRKFDEKYGDRKGRRKKGPGMGFGGTTIVEKDSESARVRKSTGV